MFAAGTTGTDALSVHADRKSVSLWYQTVIHVTKAVSGRIVGDEFGKGRRGVLEVGRVTPIAITAANGVRSGAVVAWLHFHYAALVHQCDRNSEAFFAALPQCTLREYCIEAGDLDRITISELWRGRAFGWACVFCSCNDLGLVPLNGLEHTISGPTTLSAVAPTGWQPHSMAPRG